MSNLKRTSSLSNIPRLSRLTVRQSSHSKAARSSSARPSSTNVNLLCVPGSGTMGRSSSYSNLNTPCRPKIIVSTPSTSASKNFKLHDKEWQKVQIQRVQAFLYEFDPEIPPLKPLSLKVYVQTMNLLWKQVDGRLTITQANYKDTVPEYLKGMNYPHQIKPSVMKTPAVPSSFPYILQIWIWIIDQIELIRTPDRILNPHISNAKNLYLFHATLKYFGSRFMRFNNRQGDDHADVDEQLVETLAQINDAHHIDYKALEDEESSLISKKKTLLDILDNGRAEIADLTQKFNKVSESNRKILQEKNGLRNEKSIEIAEMRIKMQNLQMIIKEREESVAQLKATLSGQPYSVSALERLKEKVAELHHTDELQEERIKQKAELINSYKMELSKNRQQLLATIYEINNKITTLSYFERSLKQLYILEDISNPDFPEHLKQFMEKKRQFDVELSKTLQKLKATLAQKTQEHKKELEKIEAIHLKIEELTNTGKDRVKSFQNFKADFNEKYTTAISIRDNKRKGLQEILSEMPDVNKMKQKVAASLERQQQLKTTQDEVIAKFEDLCVCVYNCIKETIDTEKEMASKISEAIDKSFPSNFEELIELVKKLAEEVKIE